MPIMLDVHVAVIPTVPENWINQCIESIQFAMERAGFPINLHVVEGVMGHIGKARALGYSQGSAKYVTYVDCDDFILPDAFNCLEQAMAQNPAMIRTNELALRDGHYSIVEPGAFHLIVYRRDILEGFDFDKHPLRIDVETLDLGLKHPDGFINIPSSVYVQRMYWDSGSRVLAREMAKSDELKNG